MSKGVVTVIPAVEGDAFLWPLEDGEVMLSEVDDLGGLTVSLEKGVKSRVLVRFASGHWAAVFQDEVDD